MHHEDPNADNLLLRLFSYTPREKRRQDEDFCTECLAWILRNSSDFRASFLSLIDKNLTGADWKISTQKQFAGEEETSRFDLVLEPNDKAQPIVLIECKVDAQTEPFQIEKYHRHSKRVPGWTNRERMLVLLTKEKTRAVEKLTTVNRRIYWADVHRICRKLGQMSGGNLSDYPIQWFASVLEEKSMNQKEIPPLPNSLAAQTNSELLVEAIEGITSRALKSALPNIEGRISVKSAITDKGNWRGCGMKLGPEFSDGAWAGFLLRHSESGVELLRWVEFSIDEILATDRELAEYIQFLGWRDAERKGRHLYWHAFEKVSPLTPCSESEEWLKLKVIELSQEILPKIQARTKAMASG